VKPKTSEVNPEESTFAKTLEELEELLHSETQAIVASDVEKLEKVLFRKEITLRNVLTERDALEFDPRQNHFLDNLLDRILQIQQRNKHTLDHLVDTHGQDVSDNGNGLRIRKIRNAYLSHNKEKDDRMLDV
jgi:hypothetical protein